MIIGTGNFFETKLKIFQNYPKNNFRMPNINQKITALWHDITKEGVVQWKTMPFSLAERMK